MDDITSPAYARLTSSACPECERSARAHLEHAIRGDVVTSTWQCDCGARWLADADLGPRTADHDAASSVEAGVLGDLRDLVAALDRRLPHGDAGRERLVAGMSASLRRQAVDRITHLETAPGHSRENGK